MGQSASAYLAYGFELPEELPEVFDGNDSFDNEIRVVPFGYDYSGKFLAASFYRANWEGLEKVWPNDLTIKPEWESNLKEFCVQYGLEYKQPIWCLMTHFA